jgi:hypothetical protein
VHAQINAATGSSIVAKWDRNFFDRPGTLVLGRMESFGAVNIAGSLGSDGYSAIVLMSANAAELGGKVNLHGATLTAVNGTHLASSGQFSGGGTIDGVFVNDGHVGDGTYWFLDDVSGGGSFSGEVHFQGHYTPGSGSSRVDFGQGRIAFDDSAVLTLAIGSQHGELAGIESLSFQGQLTLAFGSGFDARPGQRIALLDFGSFSGSLDPGRVTVQGFDVARLDLSRLALDGTIAVTAVPEPAPALLLAAGLAALRLRARRLTA